MIFPMFWWINQICYVNWLIDRIGFYAVLAIFQPCKGGGYVNILHKNILHKKWSKRKGYFVWHKSLIFNNVIMSRIYRFSLYRGEWNVNSTRKICYIYIVFSAIFEEILMYHYTILAQYMYMRMKCFACMTSTNDRRSGSVW